MSIRISKAPFGATAAGEAVTAWTMENDGGMTVRVLDYGGVIQSLTVPGRDGRPVDVALGYDDIAGYEAGTCCHGALVGRFAGRIGGAAYSIGGRTYTFSKNDGENHLHGTFERRLFDASVEDGSLVLRLVSPDGEGGHPGTLRLTAAYTLTEDNALVLDYRAVTDADTHINITNHNYYNLSGHAAGDVLAHRLRIDADAVLELDTGSIPTGRLYPVGGTPFDFRTEKAIGADIGDDNALLRACDGYDHSYVLPRRSSCDAPCGELYSPDTGITLSFGTTQPAMHLYTGNFLETDAAPYGKGGVRYPQYGGLALESQHFPDSPNKSDFPSTLLRPGEEYRETSFYRFGVR